MIIENARKYYNKNYCYPNIFSVPDGCPVSPIPDVYSALVSAALLIHFLYIVLSWHGPPCDDYSSAADTNVLAAAARKRTHSYDTSLCHDHRGISENSFIHPSERQIQGSFLNEVVNIKS